MNSAPRPKRVQFGQFELDLQSGELYRLGRKIRLQGQTFLVLSALIERAGQVVTREELQQRVWPADIYIDFEHGLNNAIKRLREALNDSPEKPRYIETLPRKGYRFIAPVFEPAAEPEPMGPETEPQGASADTLLVEPLSPEGPSEQAGVRKANARFPVVSRQWLLVGIALVLISAAGFLAFKHRPRPLTDRDTIVVADFVNTTGDEVFDGTLREGLVVQLGQSPFLSLVSEMRIQQLLGMMARPTDAHLTAALARELCERNGSAAFFDGSIATLGKHYLLSVRATNCRTGDLLGEEQVQAGSKEEVPGALDSVAKNLRRRVGESITTVERYDTPLADATTPSLEALKAYSAGVQKVYREDPQDAIPFFQRAVSLDPGFAAAYAMMSCACIVQPDLATRNIRKAYALREKVSERERLFIESTYDEIALGDLNKSITDNQIWATLYPREYEPARTLEEDYLAVGDASTAAQWGRKALALGGENPLSYQTLALSYWNLNRLDEAKILYKQDEDRKLADPFMNRAKYFLAFAAHDTVGMAEYAARDMGKPGSEDAMLDIQADTARWFGKLKLARELTTRASDSAKYNKAIELAAIYQAKEAFFEAEIGNPKSARATIESSMKLSQNRQVQEIAALVLARIGDSTAAEHLASEIQREHPQDTLAAGYWLPAIHAAIALQRHHARQAIVLSRTPSSMALAFSEMLTVYLRGEAYMQLRDGKSAAAELQEFLDHWGLVRNAPEGAFARLALARAYAMQGKVPEARAAYKMFLTLWKDADPDIPLLQQARAESAQL